MHRSTTVSIALSIVFLSACDDKKAGAVRYPQEQQFARVQILNALSATDGAIRALGFANPAIESISPDRGGTANGALIEQFRGWSIHLSSDVEPGDRKRLLTFLQGLEEPYDDLNRTRYTGHPDFDFSFTVTETEDRIDVVARGSYGIK